MPRLFDLSPQFVKYVTSVADSDVGQPLPDGTMQWGGFPQEQIHHVETIEEAQGIWFLCPLCFVKNNGPIGAHIVDVTFAGRGALDHQGSHSLDGKPSRWTVSGTGYVDLTTLPSIHLTGPGCGWHGYITNGEATTC